MTDHDSTDRPTTDDTETTDRPIRPTDLPLLEGKWLAGATAATTVVAMDSCGGPIGNALDLETTDRYEAHARWDDAAHLLAGYSLGVALSIDGADRPTVCRRFLAVTSAWELFEYAIGERPWDGSCSTAGAVVDTVADTVMGTVGAWIAASHE